LTTLFIALFIATAKRRAEIVINQSNNDSITRQVLVDYNNQFLEHLLIISNIATLVFYALYTMTHGGLFIWSIFFVIYAMFRYLWLVLIKNIGEEPEKIIITDKPILFSIFGWAIFVILVLYL
jgi:4-hydroxybenzoate polyprenyltransferase